MQLVEPGAARRIEVARARAACAGLAQRVGVRSGVDMTLGILVLGQQGPANRHRIRQDRLVPDMQRNARSAQHPLDALWRLRARSDSVLSAWRTSMMATTFEAASHTIRSTQT